MLLLIVLFPIAVYLAILGWINRRAHGLLVSGPWDFVGVLFAASGFLLFGGPSLIEAFMRTEAWNRVWVQGRIAADAGLAERLAAGRLVLYGGYFLLVLGLSAFLLWRRRRLTAIYNVSPQLVEAVLGEVFHRLQLSFVQSGNVLLIEPTPGAQPAAPLPSGSILLQKVTTLEVEASHALGHVSLWWEPSHSLLRREVELELRRALVHNPAPENSVADWLFLISSTLFLLLIVGAGILVLLRFLRN